MQLRLLVLVVVDEIDSLVMAMGAGSEVTGEGLEHHTTQHTTHNGPRQYQAMHKQYCVLWWLCEV
jgi:hypothetical protein